ncbi:hypothetical protein TNCV_3544441 [Trichonephila clavipes]|nr:hypothetical protein TNCV_3544441 [Trichonephila clavipes]
MVKIAYANFFKQLNASGIEFHVSKISLLVHRHEVTECKRTTSSSRSGGTTTKTEQGPERQLNKRGAPSSFNSNGHFRNKIRQYETPLQLREISPYKNPKQS